MEFLRRWDIHENTGKLRVCFVSWLYLSPMGIKTVNAQMKGNMGIHIHWTIFIFDSLTRRELIQTVLAEYSSNV